MGGLADHEVMKPCVDLLESWNVPYEIQIVSALRTPDRALEWADEAESRGVEVIIAASAFAAGLPGLLAGASRLPVIGVPIEAGALQGLDALYSTVQTPLGTPVATVGVNAAVNAAVLALQILGRLDEQWLNVLDQYRAKLSSKLDQQNAQLKILRPAAIWPDSSPTPSHTPTLSHPPTPTHTPTPTPSSPPSSFTLPTSSLPPPPPPPKPAVSRAMNMTSSCGQVPYIGRVRIEEDDIPIEVIEQAVDCLLEGGIIAIPTETVYGLAADATNEEAVRRLFALKERSPSKSIAIFIDSQKFLGSLVRNLTPDVRNMLEAFWPGPLTVVFEKQGRGFGHVAPGSTLGVRIPDHSTPLMLMQELRRPIACTSANLSGESEARSGDDIERIFGRNIEMILDAGELPDGPTSTVVDVTQSPWRVLREGAISRSQLAAVVGELINND